MTKIKSLRVLSVLLVIVVVASGAAGTIYYGGLCTIGIDLISLTCPLGFAQRSLAARELMPQWTGALLAVGLVVVLGRVFCAWVCPAVLIRRVFGDNGGPRDQHIEAAESAWKAYSPYAVLGGTLVASFVLQFPVFCFFCPIGLFFGALYAVLRFFSPAGLSVELVLFPAALILELWVLKSWCRTICPMGALLSLFGNLNRFFVPTFNKAKCLAAKGNGCHACERICPEKIYLPDLGKKFAPQSCTKCLACWEKCPAKSVEIAVVK